MGDRAYRERVPVMLRPILAFVAALALVLPVPAMSWGYYAHGITGRIAMANVSPQVQAKVYALLKQDAALGTPDCPIDTVEQLASWADCVRREGWRWGYTAAWHYRTAPICEAYDARRNCPGGNCVTAQIDRNHRILADESLPAAVRLEALAFLVHFVGDVHQPLHSGDKEDRGGNGREASYGIVPDMNLHWIWDGALAERAVTSGAEPIVRRYSAEERAALTGGDAAEWGRESWQIARDFLYPSAFDRPVCEGELPDETALSQEDIVESVPVARRRVQQAGLRIADMLESAFAPGPLPLPERDR
ncbi:S1/P1 nuclease [Altererythrobacter epoxidivorans]|uniref:S1/P1 nuclease n=1 Tax=Altererythrobacter epoxidivorans TaxID=361183 RepID=UPI0009F98E3C|nr:S1/P1 nuclease [Altererythrobacter epoxidivorans]